MGRGGGSHWVWNCCLTPKSCSSMRWVVCVRSGNLANDSASARPLLAGHQRPRCCISSADRRYSQEAGAGRWDSCITPARLDRHVAAAAGKTVLCTIHQPRADVLTLFNLVYILTGGEVSRAATRHDLPRHALSSDDSRRSQCLYFGPAWNPGEENGLLRHFRDAGFPFRPFENPADQLMDIVNAGAFQRTRWSVSFRPGSFEGGSYWGTTHLISRSCAESVQNSTEWR